MDYCLTVWGSASKYQLDRILRLQKRAARIILDTPPDAPSMPLFEKLGWLTVYERLEYNKAIVLYKSTHDLTPSYVSDLFEFHSSHIIIMSGQFRTTTCLLKDIILKYLKSHCNMEVPVYGILFLY